MEGVGKPLGVEIWRGLLSHWQWKYGGVGLGSGVGLWPGGTLGSGAPSGLVGSGLVASGQVGESW